MPAMSNILLSRDVDAATDITLYPVKDDPFPNWRSNVDGVSTEGQSSASMMWQEGKTESKVNIKLSLPIMEIIPAGSVDATGRTAAPKVAGVDSFSGTFFLSNRGTQSTRAELIRAVCHLLCGAASTADAGADPTTAASGTFKTIASTRPIPYAIVNKLYPGA